MSAESDVYAGLSVSAGVVALVSNRIYPDIAAQGVLLPLIVYERTSTNVTHTIHDGLPVASQITISASAWAITRLLAEQIADQMQIALRALAITTNRFSHYDADAAAYAAVVDFEVWEL